MGVYHLMGLGRSLGTVIGPLTYLAHRYQRWNDDDKHFFSRSGEVVQRLAGQKMDNQAGRITTGPLQKGGPTKEGLRKLLRREWPAISGGRKAGEMFWCEVDRRDIRTTYERVVKVVAALAGVGGQGKEMWANLTGGNNVINAALELAAMLSGDIARLYYVQAENPDAEKCVRFTAESGYWVELHVIPLALGRLSRAIIDLLAQLGSVPLPDLYSLLVNEYYDLSRGLDSAQVLRDEYLAPLWKQGLITEQNGGYTIGPQWELVRVYQEVLEHARQANMTIERLARSESWLERESISLS